MQVFVIVGENKILENISARAVYSTRALAEAHIADRQRTWFDNRNAIVELELDAEVPCDEAKPDAVALSDDTEAARLTAVATRLKTLAKEATNGWACYASTKLEHDDISRLHRALDAIDLTSPPPTRARAAM